ncbi:sensor histidine kinase [Streptomyces sp. NPDC055749]
MRRPRRPLRHAPGQRSLSIHGRLFLGFGIALGACAALMVAIIYIGMRFLPTYDFSTTVVVPNATSRPMSPAPTTGPFPSASPAPPLVQGEKAERLGGISSKEDVWNTVLLVSAGGVVLVMAVGLGAGWLISKRLLAPLHTISEAATKAADGDLTERINAHGPDDELKQLADTFDTMLARLQQSFTAHQRFAANASHELLTPLATTRAILQIAADDPTGTELTELTPMLQETNERNISVVRALLDLAASDHAAFDPTPVDLADLAEHAIAARAAQAEAKEIRLGVDTEIDCEVTGSSTLLRQLLLNLLDNALTHNEPASGRVHLAVFRDGAKAVVEVNNTGPHVDATVVERLFEPFYRAHSRIGSDRSGHGLGLAIVRSIATAHHGTVTATANPTGGLTLRVELPTPFDTS